MTEQNTTEPTAQLTEAEIRERRIDQAHAALVEGTALELRISGSNRSVTAHPLASAFPVISRAELAELVADIEANGLQQQIVMIGQERGKGLVGREQQVLEGRSRFAALWVLGKPVTGSVYQTCVRSEDEMLSLVVSANIVRRHLNPVQRGLLVRRFFLPAELEASATRKGGRPKQGEEPRETGPVVSGRAVDRAAERAGGLISGRTVADLELVERAPKSYAKAMAGKYATAQEAIRAAEAELDVEPTKRRSTTRSASGGSSEGRRSTTFGELGLAVEANLKNMLRALEKPGKVSTPVSRQRDRIARLRAMLDQWEVLLDAREGGAV